MAAPLKQVSVAWPQPKMRDLWHLRDRGDDRPMTGLQPLAGVAHAHAFLMAVLVEQGKRIQIQRVALAPRRQILQCPAVQTGQRLPGAAAAPREEARQRRLARDRLDAEHLRHRRIVRQMRHAGELVRPAQDPADKTQRGVARIVRVRTRRRVRQHRPQLLPQSTLRDEPCSHCQPAGRRQALVGEADPHRLHPVFGAQIQPHRLVRLCLGR